MPESTTPTAAADTTPAAPAAPRPEAALLAELRQLAPHIEDPAMQRRALVLVVKLIVAAGE